MNYKSFNLGDWIGHISGVIEDETTLDGNEMRDLVWFLTTLKQERTTKNDLGVDAVSREEVLWLIADDNLSMGQVVKGIHALPSVTPQEQTDKNFTKADIDAIVKAINEGWELRVNEVLDKIRAEIIEKYWDCDICKYNGHFNIRGDINDILQIIDKYKAEVEPQESER